MARIRLDMISTTGLSRSFFVNEGGCVIGRSLRAQIRVALPSVAPRHALIEFVDGCFAVRPCNRGISDVFVNDEVVPHGGRVIGDADVLRIGMTSFKVHALGDELAETAIELKPADDVDMRPEPPEPRELRESAFQSDAGSSPEEVAAAPGD